MKLVDNGLDSFKKSIRLLNRSYTTSNEFQTKEIILSLHHCIETLFKQILIQTNEYLVYEDVNAICKQQIENLYKAKKKDVSQNTIQYIDAINRVIIIKKIIIPEWEYVCFKHINGYRNAITHYEISFNGKEVEHLISKILPVLYRIFSEQIPQFKQYCKDNCLETNIKEIKENYYVWSFPVFAAYIKKINKAKDHIAHLEANPQLIQTIYLQLKEKMQQNHMLYECCPVCQKEAFLKCGTVIIDGEEKIFYGYCEYCNIEIVQEEAYFIFTDFGTYENIINYQRRYLEECIEFLLNYEKRLSRISAYDLRKVHQGYQILATEVNEISNNIINGIVEVILENEANFEYVCNIDGVVEYGESMLRSVGYILRKNHEIDCLQDRNYNELLKIVDNFNSLSKEDIDVLSWGKSFENSYEFDFNYPDPSNDNIEQEGTCEINVKFNFDKNQFVDDFTFNLEEFEEALSEYP